MDQSVLTFISSLGQAVLLAILPILAGTAVRWVLVIIRQQAAKLDQQSLVSLMQVATIAVTAAEQAGAAGIIADKKGYALAVCHSWLESHGINIDIELLDAAVESAVKNEINFLGGQKQIDTPTGSSTATIAG